MVFSPKLNRPSGTKSHRHESRRTYQDLFHRTIGAKGAKIVQSTYFVNDKKLLIWNAKPLLRGYPWGAPEPVQAQQNRVYEKEMRNYV